MSAATGRVVRLAARPERLRDVEAAIGTARTFNPPLAELLESIVGAWKASLEDIDNLTEAEAERWGEVCRVAARIARGGP